MTKVISLRLPIVLVQMIGRIAIHSKRPVRDIVRAILEHSLDGRYNFRKMPDVVPLDAKFDVRLPEQLVLRLRDKSKCLGISISVYSRIILYAYCTNRLVFVEADGRYTLAEKREQVDVA